MSIQLKLRLLAFALIALSFLAVDRTASASNCPRKSYTGACTYAFVSARNPDTGECCLYPTPCMVPDGWQIYDNPLCEDVMIE